MISFPGGKVILMTTKQLCKLEGYKTKAAKAAESEIFGQPIR